MNNEEKIKKINQWFGSYRAEWLKDDIFQLFSAPSYFVSLQDSRPCVLQGGRGTGKTTILRSMSYAGQYALCEEKLTRFNEIPYIGIYLRMNTNRVRAFYGGGLDSTAWSKIFAHYFNLIICKELLLFVKWYNEHNSILIKPVASDILLFLKSLSSPQQYGGNVDDMLHAIDEGIINLQAGINNVSLLSNMPCSIAGEPIRLLSCALLQTTPLKGKMFYFLLDEYENLEDYQQQVVNTLLKHNDEYLYTFKIGVREFGWRVRYTLNCQELLNEPADYTIINIEEKFQEGSAFSDFASRVCNQRIMKMDGVKYSAKDSFGDLTSEDEAMLLKVQDTQLYKDIVETNGKIPDPILLPELYWYVLAWWAKSHNLSYEEVLQDYRNNTRAWDERYGNYKYEALFSIRRGKGKSGVQKFYAGWDTYIKLANGNIRYLMELVYTALEIHLVNGADFSTPVSFEDQTKAAKIVSRKHLKELEGLWNEGAKLTKLLYGLGQVFHSLTTAKKSAPEVNQFYCQGVLTDETDAMLRAGVMNLALVRMEGNKPNSDYDTKESLYSLHPIFSPFFMYSYRKKRKMKLTNSELLGLATVPAEYVQKILKNYELSPEDVAESVRQLTIFDVLNDDK